MYAAGQQHYLFEPQTMSKSIRQCTSCSLRAQVFTESTHIVAIRTSGNVYAYEAVQELNIKPKFMKDLLTDQPFTRKDIIHIQDPMNLEASACMLHPCILF